MYTLGVLGFQDAVQEHLHQIEAVGCQSKMIKHPDELTDIDGLILPGGESTTMRRLIDLYGFLKPLQCFGENKPIFGTCAGMVLLANELANEESPHLQLIDMKVKRNAFGRQIDSFEEKLKVKHMNTPYPAVFIRAPYVESASPQVEVLATVDGNIVAARQGHILVTSFHPELTDDIRFMEFFKEMVVTASLATT